MRYAKILLIPILTWVFFESSIVNVQAMQDDDIFIRVAHFSPDAGLIDVYANGILIAGQLPYGVVSNWMRLSAVNIVNVSVVASGDSPGNALAQTTVVAQNLLWNTLTLSGLNVTNSLLLQNIPEDHSEVLPGEARFAFFHAVQGVPALDLLLNDTVLFQLVGYPDASSTERDNDGYVSVDVVASDYEVRIQENLSGDVPIEPFELTILPDRIYLVALIGTADQVEIVITSDVLSDVDTQEGQSQDIVEDETAHLRFANFSSGAGDVDFYIDDTRLTLSSLGFTGVTVFFDIPPGQHRLSVRSATQPESESLVPETEIDLVEGEWMTIATIGLMDNGTFTLQMLEEDFSNLAEGDVRLTIFHAVPGIDALDITANGAPLISLLGYPGSQGDNDGLASVDLLAGTYAIQVVNSANSDDIFVDLGEINFAEGNHFLLALIRANPPFVFTYVPME